MIRLINSFKYAWQGIKHCFISEKNFRIQLLIAAIVFLAGIIFKISATEWLAILFCSSLVLGFEMINTTIEKLSNLITESIRPEIKIIKDVAAGAVFLASIISFVMGCIIFLPKINSLLNNFVK